jgi:hypothetical protein
MHNYVEISSTVRIPFLPIYLAKSSFQCVSKKYYIFKLTIFISDFIVLNFFELMIRDENMIVLSRKEISYVLFNKRAGVFY